VKAEGHDLAPLARRIETAHAAQLERTRAARGAGAPAIPVAGGVAICHGPRSPFSAAVGLAIGTPVTGPDVDLVEAHLGIGGGPVRIEVTPFTDPSLTEELGRRGYQLERFFQVWVRTPGPESPGAEVRPATPAESAAWVEVFSRSHMGAPTPSDGQREALTAMLRADGNVPWLAFEGGVPVGVALSSAEEGVAWLSGAGVLPASRGGRIQESLVRARIAWAHATGCDVTASATEPATASQRTLERCGFRAAYPKAVLVR
jgi:GNAT superfamily N-acetyltransferase